MPRYRVTLAYDGTAYRGWQAQPAAPTIQATIESALARLAKEPVRVVGAGRTDAGVHAHGQVAHFVLPHPIPPDALARGLNALLPFDVRCLDAATAPDDFHARKSARSKTYRYFLDRAPVPTPFRVRFTLHHPYPLDRDAIENAASAFIGRKDFAAFSASASEARTTVRHVTVSRFLDEGGELVYEVAADGFLHHMVRNIVGTLLEVGRGKLSAGDVARILASRERGRAGPTAPARGLHLMRVEYD